METCSGVDCEHEKCHSGPGIGGMILGAAEIAVGAIMLIKYLFRSNK